MFYSIDNDVLLVVAIVSGKRDPAFIERLLTDR